MPLKQFINFVRIMYDDNCAEWWEAGMKPFSNEWEYLTKNLHWLEKEFYHKQAIDWRHGTVWDKQFDRNQILDLTSWATNLYNVNEESIKAIRYLQEVSEALTIPDVSQQRELLDLLTEIANSDTLYSNTRHRMIARKLLKSNCG